MPNDPIPYASETQFRQCDWRPSRKRATYERLKPYGGQKRAPLAFLQAAKANGFGKGGQKRCSVEHCQRFAYRENGLCGFHGGPLGARASRPYVRGKRRQRLVLSDP
jgi:hypothetical protein